MEFVPDLKAPSSHAVSDLWFVFSKGKLLTRIEHGRHHIPAGADLEESRIEPFNDHYLGALNGRSCYAANLQAQNGHPDLFQLTDTCVPSSGCCRKT